MFIFFISYFYKKKGILTLEDCKNMKLRIVFILLINPTIVINIFCCTYGTFYRCDNN